MREADLIYDKKWTGARISRGEHIREQIIDSLKVPDLYRGKKIAVYICLSAEEGTNK
jgi:hypothetical protein